MYQDEIQNFSRIHAKFLKLSITLFSDCITEAFNRFSGNNKDVWKMLLPKLSDVFITHTEVIIVRSVASLDMGQFVTDKRNFRRCNANKQRCSWEIIDARVVYF